MALIEGAEAAPATPPAVTDIRQDLVGFDTRFGLPAARVRVSTPLAGSSADPWLASTEEVEDTELVHAVAPAATIVEIPVNAAYAGTAASLTTAFGKLVPL